jgi:hypothetical protein
VTKADKIEEVEARLDGEKKYYIISLPQDDLGHLLEKIGSSIKGYEGCVGAGCGTAEYEFDNPRTMRKGIALLRKEINKLLDECILP